ncbi:MAG TPA: hypothetical protein VFD27_08240, partial [Chthoniobacteraceae bacterium]|nr:hypothetical protein [Chthoniobacteraceae bacterium]
HHQLRKTRAPRGAPRKPALFGEGKLAMLFNVGPLTYPLTADGGGAVGKCEGFAGSGGATAGEPGSDISGKDESGFQSTFPPSDQARSLGVNSPDNNRAFTSSSESGPDRFPSCET